MRPGVYTSPPRTKWVKYARTTGGPRSLARASVRSKTCDTATRVSQVLPPTQARKAKLVQDKACPQAATMQGTCADLYNRVRPEWARTNVPTYPSSWEAGHSAEIWT